jgi:hypothetical protein
MSKVAGARVPANPNLVQVRIPGAPEVATDQDKVAPSFVDEIVIQIRTLPI